jgi:AcrR family transcriptional regulator
MAKTSTKIDSVKRLPQKAAASRAVPANARAAVLARGEATKKAILEHATGLARVVGLKALTIGTLAGVTGLSKSGLFAHFGSKEALQVEVVQAEAQNFLVDVVMPALRQPRGEPRIRAMFEGFLQWAQREGGCFFTMASAELDDDPVPARHTLAQAQRDWIDTVATAAQIAIAEGHFRGDLDVRQFAYHFESLLLGYHHFLRLLNDADTAELSRSAFESLLAASRA